jgi:predicted nucleotidyltransferase
MTEDRDLGQILEILKREFTVCRAFLFGSRAKETSHADSDYDLLLIVEESPLNQTQRIQKAQQALWDSKVYHAADVFIYTNETT